MAGRDRSLRQDGDGEVWRETRRRLDAHVEAIRQDLEVSMRSEPLRRPDGAERPTCVFLVELGDGEVLRVACPPRIAGWAAGPVRLEEGRPASR